MDLNDLVPFIKQALLAQNPNIFTNAQDVNQSLDKYDDPDSETADDDIADIDKNKDVGGNLEGKMIDSGFKELEVEEMLEKEKKQKALMGDGPVASGFGTNFAKTSSYWDHLVVQYGNNSRKNSSKA